MTDKLFQLIWQDAQQITDIDAFVSDWALSGALLPDGADIDPVLVERLQMLWHIANDPFALILKLMDMTQTQAAVRFCIPLRTIQDWHGERRKIPPYIRLFMAESTDLMRLRDYEAQKA